MKESLDGDIDALKIPSIQINNNILIQQLQEQNKIILKVMKELTRRNTALH